MKEEFKAWLEEQQIINNWSDATIINYRASISNIDVSNNKTLLGSLNLIKKKSADKTYNQKINVLKSFLIFLEENRPSSLLIPTLRKLNEYKINGNQWLFTRHGSRPNLQSGAVFKSLESKLGFKLKAHSGRSTYATKEYEITTDVKLVQEQLGHSSSATTDKYIQRSLKQRKKLIKKRGSLYK